MPAIDELHQNVFEVFGRKRLEYDDVLKAIVTYWLDGYVADFKMMLLVFISRCHD